MTDPKPDDERLSAFIDGRLQGRQRDELLAHLADDEEDYQLFVDSADVLHELQEEDAREGAPSAAGTLPPSMRRRGWRTPRVYAISAILVGFAALGVFALRGRASLSDPVHLAANLERADEGLPNGWSDSTVLLMTRGGGADARAADAGAQLVDLAVAIQAGDAENIQLIATQLKAAFDPRATEGPLLQIAARAEEPAASLEPLLAQATKRLEGSLERDHLRLGAWTEAARLAARRGDERFFRSGATRTALRHARELTEDDPAARDALARVRTRLAAEGGPDWAGLEHELGVLLGAIAS